MKKIILTALVAVASLTANAQVWLGGDIAFGTKKLVSGGDNLTTFTLAPQVGYMFSEKFGLGLDLKLGLRNDAAATIAATNALNGLSVDPADYAKTTFGFDVFARYVFAKTGIASFFFDGGVGFTTYKDCGSRIGVGIQPGVKFAASEKVDVVAKMGYLGWHKYLGDKSTKGSAFAVGIEESVLSLGVSYNF